MNVRGKVAVQILLLALAIGCVFYGIAREEVETVFLKAVKLCLECVGIG